MAITTLAGYNGAKKQTVETWWGGVSLTTASGNCGSAWTGTLAGANTANGVVPTDADMGATDDKIDPFVAGGNGYVTKLLGTNDRTSASYLYVTNYLFDMVFKAGAYSFNSNVTLSSQPSYSSRIPSGTDYTNTEIWFESVTAFTGNPVITVTYTNQSGVAGRSTSLTLTAPIILRRMDRFPLQAGDTGVQKIESVVATTATVGTFNILVLRRLALFKYNSADASKDNLKAMSGMMDLGMPQVFDNSCLFMIVRASSTNGGAPYFQAEIASG